MIEEKSSRSTEGVDTLLGDPKKAIVKLAIPIILASAAHAVFQLADIVWVSGLGADALSAVGFFNPLFIFTMAIASGIAVGGGTCISQRIGAKDKNGADQIAKHMFLIILLVSLLFISSLLLVAEPLFLFMGAEKTIASTLSYGRIMILNFFFLFLIEGAATVFRSEGNSKRASTIYLLGIVLNLLLDPIFIYTLGMGVAGAAWASLASMGVVTLICGYFLLAKGTNYLSIRTGGFKFDKTRLEQILKLGVPVSLAQFVASLMVFVNTMIVARIAGPDGVAVYSGGLRVWFLTLLPLTGIGSAFIIVVGAAWGAESEGKLRVALAYTLKLTFVVEGALMVLTFLAAPLLTRMITWSKEAGRLADDFNTFFRVIVTVNLAAVITFIAEALFVGVGEGTKKLYLSALRSILFVIPLTATLGILLDYGLIGVWTGIAIGNWAAAMVAIVLTKRLLKRIKDAAHRKPALDRPACPRGKRPHWKSRFDR
ncbi:MAG: MATE family efflux transporter [Proteobacteria bacterium]|nr:MATE family efflux transporter [Pseudomonadota bacterium]